MKVRNVISLTLVAGLVAGLAACGADNPGSDTGDIGGDTIGDGLVVDAPGDAVDQDTPRDIPVGDILDDAPVGDVPGDTVDAADSTEVYVEQCPYPTKIEIEEPAETGVNDEFSKAQPILLDEDVTGHIGAANDTDWYAFCVPEDGIVDIHIDFQTSYDANGVYSMLFAAYTDGWLASNTSVVGSEYDGSCFEQFPVTACLAGMDVKMSVSALQGRYAFKLTGGSDLDGFWAGYDATNPYTVRIEFTAGPDLEAAQPVGEGTQAIGSVDIWKTALGLLLDQNGMAEVESYGWYWNDIDWYKIHLDEPGWVRVVSHIDPLFDGEGYPTFTNDGSLLRMGENGPEDYDNELSWSVPYNDNCGTNRSEATVIGGADYYVRVFSAPGSQTNPYSFTFEYHPGSPEDDQPAVDGDAVGAAEDSAVAFDMGEMTVGGTLAVSSYFWHYFDFDWYKFTVPEGAGQDIEVTLDFTETYNELGWYDCPDNEDGVEVWMYLFEEGSFDYPGIAQGYEHNVPTQVMNWTVEPGKTYYINVMSRENWDKAHPYTLTIVPVL